MVIFVQKKLVISKAETQWELEECMKVRNLVFTIEKNVPQAIEVDGNDTLGGKYEHFYAKIGDNYVGAVRCFRIGDKVIKVQRFCVVSEYRRQKIGRGILSFVENYYAKAGIEMMELDSKFAVSRFYERCGYEPVSEIFMEADVEHIRMKKNVSMKKRGKVNDI